MKALAAFSTCVTVALLASVIVMPGIAGGWFFGKQLTAKDYDSLREAMVNDQIVARGIHNKGVLQAMRQIPRHLFVPEDRRASAYEDRPLPIGYDQTISQPYIVAYMTELLQPEGSGTVLEVGTGSGYQAAVLSRLYRKVYTIEIIAGLAESAKVRLRDLGFSNVEVRTGDGYAGWPDKAPFDAIMVTAAAGHIPQPLVSQLKAKGRMVIPVGSPSMIQHIILVEKDEKGNTTTKSLLPVRFVPLTGGRQ
ncbi:MAG TPA: protein-L-isoaspartate(D-aspartate) O-methyltransferase [Syntrophales bacterium]|nr:protein-L-isoaspartate(D-aspartate) O-methyltransferase [Syntrophales bacterium]